jgi:hypothetical protein
MSAKEFFESRRGLDESMYEAAEAYAAHVNKLALDALEAAQKRLQEIHDGEVMATVKLVGGRTAIKSFHTLAVIGDALAAIRGEG